MRMTVGELIKTLSNYDSDAQVYVTDVNNYSYYNIQITADDDPDMGNDVYITGYDD